METDTLFADISQSTDLELAVLLSLVARQHCLISTDDELLDDLAAELSLIASEKFALSYAVLDEDQLQSVESFGGAILNDNPDGEFLAAATKSIPKGHRENTAHHPRAAATVSTTSIRAGPSSDLDLDRRMVVNVIIAKSFNSSHRDVQIAALELIQKRRIFSRTTVHPVPKDFLFIPLVATSSKHVRLNHHLNDRIAMSHHHDAAQDGFANLEDLDRQSLADRRSFTSSNRDSLASLHENSSTPARITLAMVHQIRAMGLKVSMTAEIRRYIQDLVVFLRMERGVDGGISPFATTLCVDLAKYLAALHGVDYVTPSLVGLVVRKVYPHRIVLSTPDRDRSMQWGSNIDAVKEALSGLTAEKILDNVLASVQCPM